MTTTIIIVTILMLIIFSFGIYKVLKPSKYLKARVDNSKNYKKYSKPSVPNSAYDVYIKSKDKNEI